MTMHKRQDEIKETSSGCPVEEGMPCLSPDQRKWSIDKTVNIPSIIAILTVGGSLTGWLLFNERRLTTVENNVKYLAAVDTSINKKIDSNELLATRDRSEMRDDIKETKALVIKLVERKH